MSYQQLPDNDDVDYNQVHAANNSGHEQQAVSSAGVSSEAVAAYETASNGNEQQKLPPVKQDVKHVASNSAAIHSQDGVFSNLSAKPQVQQPVTAAPPPATIMSEEEHPPSYDTAQADSTPPYLVTLANQLIYNVPANDGTVADLELHTGTPYMFALTLLVTLAFQVIGYLVCTVLSSNVAGRAGARTGMGLVFVRYALSIATVSQGDNQQQPQGDSLVVAIFVLVGAAMVTSGLTQYLQARKALQLQVLPTTNVPATAAPPSLLL